MKIVFICDTLGSGGAERVISTLSNEFVIKGHDISIIMLSKEASTPFYDLNEKIRLHYLTRNNDKKISFFKKAKLLKNSVLEIKPDIVISFLSYVCIYTWWALKKTRIPFIVSERNDPNHRGKIRQLLLNMSFKKATGCVFQTEDALKWYEKIAKNKSTVIYNPVNLSYAPKSIADRKKQILYVGRFTKQKNCMMLVDAFELFYKKHPDYILKMYGDGPIKEEIIRLVLEKKLNKNFIILPSSKSWQKDEYDSSVFVLPSIYEGMPNVLAEALCLGMPCVSTNCSIGGPKELKKIFGDNLLLCDINPNSLSKEMENALMVRAGKPIIPNELNVEYITKQWIHFIESIIK